MAANNSVGSISVDLLMNASGLKKQLATLKDYFKILTAEMKNQNTILRNSILLEKEKFAIIRTQLNENKLANQKDMAVSKLKAQTLKNNILIQREALTIENNLFKIKKNESILSQKESLNAENKKFKIRDNALKLKSRALKNNILLEKEALNIENNLFKIKKNEANLINASTNQKFKEVKLINDLKKQEYQLNKLNLDTINKQVTIESKKVSLENREISLQQRKKRILEQNTLNTQRQVGYYKKMSSSITNSVAKLTAWAFTLSLIGGFLKSSINDVGNLQFQWERFANYTSKDFADKFKDEISKLPNMTQQAGAQAGLAFSANFIAAGFSKNLIEHWDMTLLDMISEMSTRFGKSSDIMQNAIQSFLSGRTKVLRNATQGEINGTVQNMTGWMKSHQDILGKNGISGSHFKELTQEQQTLVRLLYLQDLYNKLQIQGSNNDPYAKYILSVQKFKKALSDLKIQLGNSLIKPAEHLISLLTTMVKHWKLVIFTFASYKAMFNTKSIVKWFNTMRSLLLRQRTEQEINNAVESEMVDEKATELALQESLDIATGRWVLAAAGVAALAGTLAILGMNIGHKKHSSGGSSTTTDNSTNNVNNVNNNQNVSVSYENDNLGNVRAVHRNGNGIGLGV